MERFEVLFQPDGLRVKVDSGTLLTEAMKSSNTIVGITMDRGSIRTSKGIAIRPEPNPVTPRKV